VAVALRTPLDWIGVVSSFLAIRFLSVVLDSVLRRRLDITLDDTMRSTSWREVVRSYLGDEWGSRT
jgi:hypothetical protein